MNAILQKTIDKPCCLYYLCTHFILTHTFAFTHRKRLYFHGAGSCLRTKQNQHNEAFRF
jgi:hypothetical protein